MRKMNILGLLGLFGINLCLVVGIVEGEEKDFSFVPDSRTISPPKPDRLLPWEKKRKKGIEFELSGSKTIYLNYKRLAYGKVPYFFDDGLIRQETLRLKAIGSLKEKYKIEANLYDLPEQKGFEKMWVKLCFPLGEVCWGDLNLNFPYSELMLSNKNLTGVLVAAKYEKIEFKTITSTVKGEVKYQEFKYRGQGIYQLAYYPVVLESEIITVEGRNLRRNVDYEIDYERGQFNFTPSYMAEVVSKKIDEHTIIKVNYEVGKEILDRRLYGGQSLIKITPWLELGGNYVGEFDRKKEILNEIKPISHHLGSLTSRLKIGEKLQVRGEVALSEKDPNVLGEEMEEDKKQIGSAYYLQGLLEVGDLSLSGDLKKIGSGYQTIGYAGLKEDTSNWGANVSYHRPGWWKNVLNFRLSTISQDLLTKRLTVNREELTNNSELTFGQNYQLQYYFRQVKEVSCWQDHFLDLSRQFEYFQLKGGAFKKYSPTREENGITLGLTTQNLKEISLSWNSIYSLTSEINGSTYWTQSYSGKFFGRMGEKYSLQGLYSISQREKESWQTTLDLTLQSQPRKNLSSQLNYNAKTLTKPLALKKILPVREESGKIILRFAPFPHSNFSCYPYFKRNVIIGKNQNYYWSWGQRMNGSYMISPVFTWSGDFQLENYCRYDEYTPELKLIAQQNKNTLRNVLNFKTKQDLIGAIEYKISKLNLSRLNLIKSKDAGEGNEYQDKTNTIHTLAGQVEKKLKERFKITYKWQFENIFQETKGEEEERHPGGEYEVMNFVDIRSEEILTGVEFTYFFTPIISAFNEFGFSQRKDKLREKIINSFYPILGMRVKIINRLSLEVKTELTQRIGENGFDKIESILDFNLRIRERVNLYLKGKHIKSYRPRYETLELTASGSVGF
jgi:hypothetical protein